VNTPSIDPAATARETDAGAASFDELPLERGASIGRFMVVGHLGTGGMGLVLSAYDPELDRKVAIKLVRPDRCSEAERSRLVQEAQAMARLSHPNVVAVHEVGSVGHHLFVVMEYVQGRTLRQACEDDRPRAEEALRLLCSAGDGLAAAHRAGLVHRDFKPDNVLVGDDGHPGVRLRAGGRARRG